jgi:hypothetical protein
MIGVAWKFPGRAARVLSVSGIGCSPVVQLQAGASRATFPRSMSASVEYYIPPGSPP